MISSFDNTLIAETSLSLDATEIFNGRFSRILSSVFQFQETQHQKLRNAMLLQLSSVSSMLSSVTMLLEVLTSHTTAAVLAIVMQQKNWGYSMTSEPYKIWYDPRLLKGLIWFRSVIGCRNCFLDQRHVRNANTCHDINAINGEM